MTRSARGRDTLASNRKELPSYGQDERQGLGRGEQCQTVLDRALHDEELRENVRNAYESARTIYDELIGKRGVSGVATRVATDKDIQDELRSTIAELRKAADRVQGKEEHKSRNGGCSCSSASCSASSSTRSPGPPDAQVALRPPVRRRRRRFTYQGGNGSGNGSAD